MVDRLSGDELPFTFDGAKAAGRDDVVFCHLGHRLVTQSLRLLRAEVWATGANQSLARVTARTVPPGRAWLFSFWRKYPGAWGNAPVFPQTRWKEI